MSTFHEGVSKNGYSGRDPHLRVPAGLIGYSSGEFFVYELDFLLDFSDIGLEALYATAHVAHQRIARFRLRLKESKVILIGTELVAATVERADKAFAFAV